MYAMVRNDFDDPYEIVRWTKEAEGWTVREEASRAVGDQGTLVIVWAIPPKGVT